MSTRPFEKPTDDLRVVTRAIRHRYGIPACGPGATIEKETMVVVAVQRRWLIQDGPVTSVMDAPPPDDESKWMHAPGIAMGWVAVRSEWRDLPATAEKQLSTTA